MVLESDGMSSLSGIMVCMGINMDDPDEIGKNELMKYYGYDGYFGVIRYYFFHSKGWILQILAQNSLHPNLRSKLQRIRGVNLGRHVYLGFNVYLDNLYPNLISIEDYVSIGMRSMVFAHSDPSSSIYIKKNYYPKKIAPTRIKRGAWIAPGCIILAGVTIGENSVVGAGSVVIKDVEPYTVVGGNPARLIKRLDKPITQKEIE